MRTRANGWVVLVLGANLLWSAPEDQQVSFARDVAPILAKNCVSCHGASQQLSQFDLSTSAAALKGGQKGVAIIPGDAAESPLYRRLTGQEQLAMPLGSKLTDAEIAIVKSWIDAGARWEGGALSAAPPPKTKEKVFSDRDRNWWAFRKPIRHRVPQVSDPRWNAHPIDAFLKKTLEAKGLEAAPPAGRRTLIRRAYLDLIGLLPPPEVVEEFVNDKAPDAWEKEIDRLLASPHYGERWGRHWLDVARYADSWGHIHDDDNPNAWRYRDYVIQSFNEDKPYDQFIREQLAGDELDEVTYEALIATGFHRIAPRVLFREKQNPHYRFDYLDDMIATTSRAFLGLTVSCARCHDHKFDPISQLDYYRMMAVFNSYIDYDHPLVPAEEAAAAEQRKAEIDAKIRRLREQIREIEEPYRKAAFEERLKAFPQDVQIAVQTPEEERTPGQKLLAEQVLSIRNTATRRLTLSDADREACEKLNLQIRELTKQLPKRFPVAAGIRDGDYRFTPDGPGDTPVPGTTGKRIKVDFEGSFVPEPGRPYEPPPLYFPAMSEPGKGTLIEPGFLSIITGGGPAMIPPLPNGRLSSGRRRALADWIASPENPLTARVMVNRIWHHHFGRGIVGSPSNFGRMGTLPSHPELLDWLATEFVRQGWRIKPMHRLILTSQAYRMSGEFYRAENAKKDPNEIYLWRFPIRRVEAEIVRDLILSASGQLNTQAGGPPFFPSLPPSVFEEVKRVGKWVLTKEEPATWRRSIYAYWKRARKFPMFEVFDQPDTMVTCAQRNSTTVPTQALTLLNNEFVLLQSQHFASRVRQAGGQTPESQVKTAYQIALSRDPAPTELAANIRFLEEQRAHHAAKPDGDPDLQALTDLCNVILNLNEFIYVQ
ncbi:MAG: PSD1 and planctomycete cytochrome C domain-containing protein [Bryobacteraceae bacterium]